MSDNEIQYPDDSAPEGNLFTKATSPFDPDGAKQWWDEMARETMETWDITTRFLATNAGVAALFDEVAIMVPDSGLEYALLESAVRHGGWQLTNAADDHVVTGPIPSNYSVHYSFLTKPSLPWRIEVMRLYGGHSPLHHTFHGRAALTTVHHSFKLSTEALYDKAFDRMWRAKWQMAQRCDSTYGRFSYWRPPVDSMEEAGSVFIKPRVNLRDAEGGAQS